MSSNLTKMALGFCALCLVGACSGTVESDSDSSVVNPFEDVTADNPFAQDSAADVTSDWGADGSDVSTLDIPTRDTSIIPTLSPKPCDSIYDPSIIPIFEIEIDDDQWAALEDEWFNWEATGELLDKPYHPLLEFRYGDEVVKNASIRLKGSTLNWPNSPDKMQFTISFKEQDTAARFHGLRRTHLDAPHNDPSFLRERLSASFFQDFGYPTACVNSAVLYVNGEYYGLYAHIESVDQEFLDRNFAPYDDGNLYKYLEKKTNESNPNQDDLDAFESALSIDEIKALINVEMMLHFIAAEAIMPQTDGYFVGGINYYTYNHPLWGMFPLPWDMDFTFDTADINADPLWYEASWGLGKPENVVTLFKDSESRARYIDFLSDGINVYDPSVLEERIIAWSDQIQSYSQEDPRKPFTDDDHEYAVDSLWAYIVDRRDFLDLWITTAGNVGDSETVYPGDDLVHFSFVETSWEEARLACEELGGELYTPKDSDEQNALAEMQLEVVGDDCWIGANDFGSTGVWADVNGTELSYLPWGPEQPNGEGTQHCVVMALSMDGNWNDKECSGYFLPYICRLPQ